jgi:hypothetical protein
LEHVRLRSLGRDLIVEAGAPAPGGQLTGHRPPLALQSEREGALGRLGDGVAVALEPRGSALARFDATEPGAGGKQPRPRRAIESMREYTQVKSV